MTSSATPGASARRSTASSRSSRTGFGCTECGWRTAKWVGRCGECQAWGTVEEIGIKAGPATVAAAVATPALPISAVDASQASSQPTGVDEFDRVLGGGLVPGAVVLLAGEPGIGKSTLLLDVLARIARSGRRTLYLTGEESAAQVRLRADRIEATDERLFLAAENDLAQALGQIDAIAPEVIVIDSVQTFASANVDGAAGGVTQVREVASAIIQHAKARNAAALLVGHVTKEGSIAGPRVLEHLVDVVLQFEGERTSRLRFVRASKNRYGPTDEVGCFDLTDSGVVGLRDPSGLFISQAATPVPGTCVTVALDGRRPLAVEVQALIAPSALTNPRRATAGLDSSRFAMVLAVLQARSGLSTGGMDVYASTVGGAKVVEPAADLAIALALASARSEVALPQRLVAFGEVGLSGEVRPVSGISRRLAEAARLGFTRAIVPPGACDERAQPDGIAVREAPDIPSALALCLLASADT